MASSSVRGEKYSKLRGIMGLHLPTSESNFRAFKREGPDNTNGLRKRQHWSIISSDLVARILCVSRRSLRLCGKRTARHIKPQSRRGTQRYAEDTGGS